MLKQSLLLSASLLISSCTFWNAEPPQPIPGVCPQVVIPRDVAYVVQKVNYQDDFQIELKGYEGYCYFDKRVNRRKAVITPKFEVRRLHRHLDETDVDFSIFTQPEAGPPEYLGKKTYFERVTLPLSVREKTFEGKTIELKVPNDEYTDFTIYLGIDISPEERKYNDRTFDIKFKYEENY